MCIMTESHQIFNTGSSAIVQGVGERNGEGNETRVEER